MFSAACTVQTAYTVQTACTVQTGKESNPTLMNSLHSRHARYAEQSDVLALHYRRPPFVLHILSRILAYTECWTHMRPHFLLPAVYLAQLRGTRPSLAFAASCVFRVYTAGMRCFSCLSLAVAAVALNLLP